MPDSSSTSESITQFVSDLGMESETLEVKSQELLGSTTGERKVVRVILELAN